MRSDGWMYAFLVALGVVALVAIVLGANIDHLCRTPTWLHLTDVEGMPELIRSSQLVALVASEHDGSSSTTVHFGERRVAEVRESVQDISKMICAGE